jgi:hypothetical protein
MILLRLNMITYLNGIPEKAKSSSDKSEELLDIAVGIFSKLILTYLSQS